MVQANGLQGLVNLLPFDIGMAQAAVLLEWIGHRSAALETGTLTLPVAVSDSGSRVCCAPLNGTPELGLANPAIISSRVVLPEPLGP
jgi:hypothetical protein